MTWVTRRWEDVLRAASSLRNLWLRLVPATIRNAVAQAATELGKIVLEEGLDLAQQVVNGKRPLADAAEELWRDVQHRAGGMAKDQAKSLVFDVFRMKVANLRIDQNVSPGPTGSGTALA